MLPGGTAHSGVSTHITPSGDVEGKISWFGGPGDPTSGPTTASGLPVAVPGIAIYDPGTLGNFWLLKGPGSFLAIVEQTDLGPAPWTGRKIDYTYTLVKLAGYTTSNFPTDSTARAVNLGKGVDEANANIASAANLIGAVGIVDSKYVVFNNNLGRTVLSPSAYASLAAKRYLILTKAGPASAPSPFFGFGPDTTGTVFGGPTNNWVKSVSDFFKNFSLGNLLKIVGGGILLLLGIYILIKAT